MGAITAYFAVLALVLQTTVSFENITWTKEQLQYLDKIRSQIMDDLKNELKALKQQEAVADSKYCLRTELESMKQELNTEREWRKESTKRLLLEESQPVAFYAILSSVLTINSNQAIPYDTVQINVGNGYNHLSGQFKAPIAGIYHFTNTVMATPQHAIHVQIVKDGAVIGRNYADSNGYESGSVSAIVELNVGDLVWVKDSDGGTETLNGVWNSFSGFLISRKF